VIEIIKNHARALVAVDHTDGRGVIIRLLFAAAV